VTSSDEIDGRKKPREHSVPDMCELQSGAKIIGAGKSWAEN
jgi:hypothetical protein